MPSVLSGVFRELELAFPVPGEYTRDPDTGQVVAGDPEPFVLRCWLKVTRDPSIQASVRTVIGGDVGAELMLFTLRGRCVDPVRLPWYIHAGMTAPLTLRGIEGEFTLAPTLPALLPEVEAQLGQEIAGIWRAH